MTRYERWILWGTVAALIGPLMLFIVSAIMAIRHCWKEGT